MLDKAQLSPAERDLVDGLEGFLSDLKSDRPLGEKYTCRRVFLELRPEKFTGERVRATRMMLSASQTFFAQFLGVSVKTHRAWEQGKTPNDMACRFLNEIARDPEYWRTRLRQVVRTKPSKQGSSRRHAS